MAKQKLNAASRIESLVHRAQMRGEALSKIAGHKVECFLSAPYVRAGTKVTKQRLCFQVDGKRMSRFDLLAFLDEKLS